MTASLIPVCRQRQSDDVALKWTSDDGPEPSQHSLSAIEALGAWPLKQQFIPTPHDELGTLAALMSSLPGDTGEEDKETIWWEMLPHVEPNSDALLPGSNWTLHGFLVA